MTRANGRQQAKAAAIAASPSTTISPAVEAYLARDRASHAARIAAEEQQTEKEVEAVAIAKFKELGMDEDAANETVIGATVAEATWFMDGAEWLDAFPTQEVAVAAAIGKLLNTRSPRYEELNATLERQIGRMVIDHLGL